MTTKHTLPSGGWVELKDPADLKAKDRKKVMRDMNDPEEGHMMGAMVDMTDGILAMMVVAWDLPYLPEAPIPSVQLDISDELSLADDQVLQGLCEPVAKMLKAGKVDPSDYTHPDGTPNLDSPSEPSSA